MMNSTYFILRIIQYKKHKISCLKNDGHISSGFIMNILIVKKVRMFAFILFSEMNLIFFCYDRKF